VYDVKTIENSIKDNVMNNTFAQNPQKIIV